MRQIVFSLLSLVIATSMSAQPRLREDNIDEIIEALTLEEKVSLLVAGDRTVSPIAGVAGITTEIARLGIPLTELCDGPAGLHIEHLRPGSDRTYYCTGFPVARLLACSWDTGLMESVAQAMGYESLVYGADVLLAPSMNIHRNPLCGRNFEYFSEDPVLSGKLAVASVKGLQSNGVGATIKHFAANHQETNRFESDSYVSQRALREIYLKNFEIAVKEGKPWTVMASYNKLNGLYTQQNKELLTTVLRDEWGFDGLVMTDWGYKDGTVNAVKAGCDLMEPGASFENDRILKGVRDGVISMEEIDRNVRHVLEYVVKTPAFKGYKPTDDPDLEKHAAIARKAAEESIVLLRNDKNALPLKGNEKVALYGVTAYDFIAGGTGSGDVHKPYVVNLQAALTDAGYKLDQTLIDYYNKFNESNAAASMMEYVYYDPWGKPYKHEPEISPTAIDYQAKNNDVAVFVLGRTTGEGNENKIIDDFELSSVEYDLIKNLNRSFRSRGKKVIVVLNVGAVIETASWKHMADAIVLPWTPGQEGANALIDIISGKVNPSGKLSTTFPLNYLDIPSSKNFPHEYNNPDFRKRNIDYTMYAEDIWVGYRYFQSNNVEVSYPFGYGLSYTTFEYSKPVVKPDADGFKATVTVTNTGSVAGKETVQLYVTAPSGGLEKPALELKAFAKTGLLAPGQSETLTMNFLAYDLASFNEDASAWETAAGQYQAKFGASVTDIRQISTFTVKKAQSWVVNDVLKPKPEASFNAVKERFEALDVVPAGQGIHYDYYACAVGNVNNFAKLPVKFSGIADCISLDMKETGDNFGIVFKGLVKIENSGCYVFSLASDDGAKLFLDGKEIINLNWNAGGVNEVWTELEKGFHRIEVQFFENTHEERLEVGLIGPGVSAESIPAEMLYHE